MPDEKTYDFVAMRGGTPDNRDESEKPYSAASYAAQYGIPMEDVEKARAQYETHGEMKAWIYREILPDPAFRARSVALDTRPFETPEKRSARKGSKRKMQNKEDQMGGEVAEGAG